MIARSTDPLFITRGRAYSFPMAWQAPDGTAIDITGFAITAALVSPDASAAATVAVTNAAGGSFTISGTAVDTDALPLGRLSELRIVITDTTGAVQDCVYPVVGETP